MSSGPLRQIFQPGADLSGMTSGGTAAGLFIEEAFQEAVVIVNEEGTEAAAVTVMSPFQSSPPVMLVDRPFYFVILDDKTETPLFIGRVMDPQN
jgi:alpha-1-antitrypsin